MKRSVPAQPTSAARWKIQSECKNLHTDILSARCIVDRLRMQFDPAIISENTDRDEVKRIAANVLVIAAFVQSIEEALQAAAD